MVSVTFVRNPFDVLASRESKSFPAGTPIGEMLSAFSVPEEASVWISLDGHPLDRADCLEVAPASGCSVVFYVVPGGGFAQVFKWVAAFALLNPGIALSSLSSVVASTAVMLPFGSYAWLRNRSKGGASGVAAEDYSATYAWERTGNLTSEGGVLPELFGTHRVFPPIVGKYVETIGGRQYLNLLLAVAGHPVDYIGDVMIGDTLCITAEENVLDGYAPEQMTNFTDVELAARAGKPTQSAIPIFRDTRSDVSVNAALSADAAVVRTTSGNAVEGLNVTLSFPKGLGRLLDDGSISANSAKVVIKVAPTGTEDWTTLQSYNTTAETVTTGKWSAGAWVYDENDSKVWIQYAAGTADPADHEAGDAYTRTIWAVGVNADGDPYQERVTQTGAWRWVANTTVRAIGTVLVDYVTIAGSQSDPYYWTSPTMDVTAGQYDISIQLYETPTAGLRYLSDVYFDTYQETVKDDFQYPGVALLSVRALATDQLSGSIPTISCIAKRLTVPVWTGAQYVQKSASNPAWACYHLLHQARYKGAGTVNLAASYDVLGEPASRIIYRDFLSWAAWCDNPAGDGSMDAHTVDIYSDTEGDLRAALDAAAMCGRGVVTQVGSKYTCIVDRPEIVPTQRFMFSMGNIVADSFTEEWLPMQDRANAVEVTYYDATQDYTRQTVEVCASDYDTSSRKANPISVELRGVTSRAKAIAYGTYLLNCNRYLTLRSSWEADVDSIASVPGDVVSVSHDVPQWGYSGRVVSATANTVKLDRSVTLAGGTSYAVMVKHDLDDKVETKNVTTGASTTDTLTISGTWSRTPAKFETFAFGEVDQVVKLMRVQRIGTGLDLRRKIEAVEYVEEVFVDGAEIPDPENISDLAAVSNLSAAEVYTGGATTKVVLSWRGFAIFWRVFYRKKGTTAVWKLLGEAYRPTFSIPSTGYLEYGVQYEFCVSGTDDPTEGETTTCTLIGKLYPPSNVATLTVTQQELSILVEWAKVADFDVAGYELRVQYVEDATAYNEIWSSSPTLFRGNALSFSWECQAVGWYALHVRAFDAFGNYSEASRTELVEVLQPSARTGSFRYDGTAIVLEWDEPTGVAASAVKYYIVSHGADYDSRTELFTMKATAAMIRVTWSGLRRFWIVSVDMAGNEGLPASIDVMITAPGPVTPKAPTVIDNNVMLYWDPPTTPPEGERLSILYYLISKGDTWAASVDIGRAYSTFITIFEEQDGSYVYWVVAYDSAGNYGTPVAIPVSVDSPTDWLFNNSWESAFAGTKTNALLSEGVLYAPVNLTETYEESFTDYSHETWAEQIDAGYAFWLQPVPNTGAYEEVFDHGSVIAYETQITVDVASAPGFGEPTITPSISVSTDGTTYDAPVNAYTRTASGFRYIKATLAVTGGDNLKYLSITALRVKMFNKLKTDAGRVELTSNGLQIDFETTFMVQPAVIGTVNGSTARFFVADVDASGAHFHGYAFDAAGGNASGAGVYVSWTARGI